MNQIFSPEISEWLNLDQEINFSDLKGKVVLVNFFQILCQGCYLFSIPLAQKMHQKFHDKGVVVLGIHSVFEDHDKMKKEQLQKFIKENRLQFPVAIDLHQGPHGIPATMRKYDLHGTPTEIFVDKRGHIRLIHFGALEPEKMVQNINFLLNEP